MSCWNHSTRIESALYSTATTRIIKGKHETFALRSTLTSLKRTFHNRLGRYDHVNEMYKSADNSIEMETIKYEILLIKGRLYQNPLSNSTFLFQSIHFWQTVQRHQLRD